ncbi:MAG: lipid-binding SYLF domain-containing protein [Planctomycetota bacterium]
MRHRLVLALVVTVALTAGCATPEGDTVTAKRAFVLKVRDDVLQEMYADDPGLKTRLENYSGYAVFSTREAKLGLLGSGNGYGVMHDNASGKDTYVKMFHLSFGPGLGYKSARALYVTRGRTATHKFASSWQFMAEAEAVGKNREKGGEASAAGAIAGDVEYRQYTEIGVMLQAAIMPRKHWLYKDLE